MSDNAVNLGTKLVLNGYVYLRSKCDKVKAYWNCNRLRKKECKVRAITVNKEPGASVTVLRELSRHEHPPDQEEDESEIVKPRK